MQHSTQPSELDPTLDSIIDPILDSTLDSTIDSTLDSPLDPTLDSIFQPTHHHRLRFIQRVMSVATSTMVPMAMK